MNCYLFRFVKGMFVKVKVSGKLSRAFRVSCNLVKKVFVKLVCTENIRTFISPNIDITSQGHEKNRQSKI